MPTKKLKDKKIRKITKIAKHSFCVALPVEIVEELGWKEHKKVVVRKSGKKIIIEDCQKYE